MSEQQNTARDEGNWAKPVDRLAATNVPAGALDTVGGKQVVSPIQGFGKMWQKTYRVSLAGADVTPARGDRGVEGRSSRRFWPKGNQLPRAADRDRAGRGGAAAGVRGRRHEAVRPASSSSTPTRSRSRS